MVLFLVNNHAIVIYRSVILLLLVLIGNSRCMRLATREDPTRKETRYLFRCEAFRTREHTLGSLTSYVLSLTLRLALEFSAAAGVNVKARYTAPTRKDCMASTI